MIILRCKEKMSEWKRGWLWSSLSTQREMQGFLIVPESCELVAITDNPEELKIIFEKADPENTLTI